MSATTRATVAATALAVPVLTETLAPTWFDAVPGHLLFAATQLLGWLLLASVVQGAPAAARVASPRGRGAVLIGCALQVSFAVVYGATSLDADPLEASFVLFMAGFVALLGGGLLWGSRLRRMPPARLAAVGLRAVAVLGALALLVGSDPLHDVFLISSYAAWVLVGRGFDLLGSDTAPDETVPVGTSRRGESDRTNSADAGADHRVQGRRRGR